MTDIDRRLRHVDRVHAPDLWDRIETREPRPSIPSEHRGRILSIMLALVVSAAGVFIAARAFISPSDRDVTSAGLQGSNTLDIPPIGEASPEFLADGRPAWVVHHRDDSVSVVDAFSTHRPFGIEELVGWCASGERFQEPAHGASFNEYGQYLDGPAEADLAHFEVERMGEKVRVGSMVMPDRRTEQATIPSNEPPCSLPGALPVTPPLRVHDVPSEELESPAAAVRAEPEGWIAVSGEVWIRPGEQTLVCGVFHATLEETTCESEAVVEGIRGEKLLEFNRLPEITLEGPWIARVEGDHLVNLTDIDRDIGRAQFTGACLHVGREKSIAEWKIEKASLPEDVGAYADVDQVVTITLTDGEQFSTQAPPRGVPVTVEMDGEWVAVGFYDQEMDCSDEASPGTS